MHEVHKVVQVMHHFGKRQVQIGNSETATIVNCYASNNHLADVEMINQIKQKLGDTNYAIEIIDSQDQDISSIEVSLFEQ